MLVRQGFVGDSAGRAVWSFRVGAEPCMESVCLDRHNMLKAVGQSLQGVLLSISVAIQLCRSIMV